jgi:hypothetical protein
MFGSIILPDADVPAQWVVDAVVVWTSGGSLAELAESEPFDF